MVLIMRWSMSNWIIEREKNGPGIKITDPETGIFASCYIYKDVKINELFARTMLLHRLGR